MAASSRESVFNPFHPLHTARLWARQQALGRAALERLGPDRVLRVRYEDLVRSPREAIEGICAFAGLDLHPAMLDHASRPAARQAARLSASWRLAGQPIQAARSGRWRRVLTDREVALVEGACAPAMRELGYEPVTDGAARVRGPLEALQVRAVDLRDRVRVELRSLREDRNHGLRWRRALRVARLRAAARARTLAQGAG